MGVTAIVKDVLMWPSHVAKQIGKGCYGAPAVGLGASVFLLGLPSAEMDFYGMAQWYVGTGACVTVSSHLLDKDNKGALESIFSMPSYSK